MDFLFSRETIGIYRRILLLFFESSCFILLVGEVVG